jgi:hypothetical protein
LSFPRKREPTFMPAEVSWERRSARAFHQLRALRFRGDDNIFGDTF